MEPLQLLVLALVQGITEFLPISSSAHLVLVPELTGWTDQGIAIDVATHLGSLLAVVIYFRRDTLRMLQEGLSLQLIRQPAEGDSGLLLKVIVATIPIVIIGLLLRGFVESNLRSASVIAWTTILFGILLFWSDRRRGKRSIQTMSMTDAALVGVAQIFALIPGVSRAGITMTAALFLGYSRAEAARFSLLISIPTILAASALIGYELYQAGGLMLQADIWLAAGLAFVAALLAISGMMSWLKDASFTPFVVYRLVLGAGLLLWLYA